MRCLRLLYFDIISLHFVILAIFRFASNRIDSSRRGKEYIALKKNVHNNKCDARYPSGLIFVRYQ
jgi:hypothetical protein